MSESTIPTVPGYYWAKWRIPPPGTHEGELDHWGIVKVNGNSSDWALSVAVPGVRETQWRDCFVWGAFVAPLDGEKVVKQDSLVDAIQAVLSDCVEDAGSGNSKTRPPSFALLFRLTTALTNYKKKTGYYNGDWNEPEQGPGCWRINGSDATFINMFGNGKSTCLESLIERINNGYLVRNTWKPTEKPQ